MGGVIAKGYSLRDLRHLFGEREAVIRGWIERGLFGREFRAGGGIPEPRVVGFVVQHHTAYDLGRVDQGWIWALVFGGVIGDSPLHWESPIVPTGRGDSLSLRRRRRRQASPASAKAAEKGRTGRHRKTPAVRAERGGRDKHDVA